MANKVDIAAASTPALVSIIIPCCGMLEYTKLCVPSILKYSRAPIELIFLDIASLDGTAEYLAGVKAIASLIPVRIEILRTQTDLGIPELCKEAIAEARGEYIVLLNNDTVVTQHWLTLLIKLVTTSEAFGMAGPMSNYAAEPQLVETVPYRIKPRQGKSRGQFGVPEVLVETDAMHQFAHRYHEEHKGKWLKAERLGGFCLLLKREVLDKIGEVMLGPSMDLGLFDTDILSMKATQAGYTLVCCRDLFIHHFGTRTFSQGGPAVNQGSG